MNFLSNSAKFTREGKRIGVKVTLEEIQKCLEDEDLVQEHKNKTPCSVLFNVEIIDEGVGMPQENLKNLFLAFGK